MLKELIRRGARKLGLGVYGLGNEYALIEPAQLRKFLSHFEIDCVFDVGANEGQYGRGLREVGYRGRILSFEPHPEVFKVLENAAKADPLWSVFQTALDSEVRQLDFNLMAMTQFSSLHEPSDTDVGYIASLNKVVRKVSLTTATLDQLYPKLQAEFGFARPYLKMDTQGHDIEVVKGGLSVIDKFIGLQSELALTKLYQRSPDFAESLAYYRSLGFSLSSLVPNNAGHFPDLVEVDCIMYRKTEG